MLPNQAHPFTLCARKRRSPLLCLAALIGAVSCIPLPGYTQEATVPQPATQPAAPTTAAPAAETPVTVPPVAAPPAAAAAVAPGAAAPVAPAPTASAPTASAPTASAPAANQASALDVAGLLKGSQIALTIKASELTSEWRQVRFGQRQIQLVDAIDPTVKNLAEKSGVYYTQGNTVASGGETFLLAYRQSPAEVQKRIEEAENPESNTEKDLAAALARSNRLPAGAVLNLSLINIRTIGNFNDIRAVDPKVDIITAEEETRARVNNGNRQSIANLKLVGLALKQYVEGHDDQLPSMLSANSMAQIKSKVPANARPTVQQLLSPHANSPEIFVHPVTRAIYRPNPALSNRNISNFDDLARIVSFYEAKPAPNGTRAVLYLDGHVKISLEGDWEEIKSESDALTAAAVAAMATTVAAAPASTTPQATKAPPPVKATPPVQKTPATKAAAPDEDSDSPLPVPEANSPVKKTVQPKKPAAKPAIVKAQPAVKKVTEKPKATVKTESPVKAKTEAPPLKAKKTNGTKPKID